MAQDSVQTEVEATLRSTLDVFTNDRGTNTWVKYPVFNYLTSLMNKEGAMRDEKGQLLIRMTAGKTPRMHVKELVDKDIPQGNSDPRPDFAVSDANGIFRLIVKVVAPTTKDPCKPSPEAKEGYDNLVAAIGEAVRCNRLVKEDWGYHIAGVVSDGFRYRCVLFDRRGDLARDDHFMNEVMKGADGSDPLELDRHILEHVTVFLRRAITGFFEKIQHEETAKSYAGQVLSGRAPAPPETMLSAWAELVAQTYVGHADLNAFLSRYPNIPVMRCYHNLNDLGHAISHFVGGKAWEQRDPEGRSKVIGNLAEKLAEAKIE